MILAVLLLLLGAPAGTALRGDALTQRTQEIAADLRCPVCQGLSIADSPSEMAINMKLEVRSMLERGYTREQIETYFVQSYGEFVLLRPKFKGVNSLVWLMPILALIVGTFVVSKMLRRMAAATQRTPRASANDRDLDRVRELVKGATS